MTTIFYRFRSTEDLLDGHNELANQEIYFASPDELNDPMEGFKDIYWHGDEVVWENLLRHYILCLEHVCSLFTIGGENHRIDRSDIPIFMTQEHLPTLQYGELYREICNRFFGNDLVGQYAKNLSRRSMPLRRDELLIHIAGLHPYVLDTIFTVYENHNLITSRSNNDTFRKMVTKAILDTQAFNLTDKAEKEHVDIESFTNTISSAAMHVMSQIKLLSRYNANMASDQKNKWFIFSAFPEVYVQEIEKMVYPNWYTACFMAECSNSSVWGHYGDKHRGVCLSFKAASENNDPFIKLHGINGWSNSGPMYGKRNHTFYKIDYEKNYVEVDFFRSLGRLPAPVLNKFWYTNESGARSVCADDVFDSGDQWREKYWANFYKGITIKLKDWDYEKEYRLIFNSFLLDLSNPASRKLKYDFNDLEAITFGIKTSVEDKLKIMKIIESKCRSEDRKDFKFYQAQYSKGKGLIDRAEMGLIKFVDDKLAP